MIDSQRRGTARPRPALLGAALLIAGFAAGTPSGAGAGDPAAPLGDEAAPPAPAPAAAAADDAVSAKEPPARAAILEFARAMREGDREAIERHLGFEEPLDRELLRAVAALARERGAGRGGSPAARFDLVLTRPIGKERVFACFHARLPGSKGPPSPMFLLFRREGDTWRAPFSFVRRLTAARARSPASLARRALADQFRALRWGELSYPEWISVREATQDSFAALAGPPWSVASFASFAEEKTRKELRGKIRALRALEGRPREEIERHLLGEAGIERLSAPGDEVLAMYFEARENSPGPRHRLALPTGGTIELDPFPCLRTDDVLRAEVSRDPATSRPSVAIELTREGGEVFSRATRENIGRRLAIVVDGKVVMAPVVRSVIRSRAQITGEFTAEQCADIARRLGAWREHAEALIAKIRSEARKTRPAGGI